MPGNIAVGIDLGTTNSVLAYLAENGELTTARNRRGDLLTPSAVFVGDDIRIGQEAIDLGDQKAEVFADYFKREMGRPHFHRVLRELQVPPEVLSAFVLRQLKQDAEKVLGPVRDAVISVPAYFDEKKRKATLDAGRLAGWNVLDIVNEPTAAALAYGYQHQFLDLNQQSLTAEPMRILVYDFGGGTFDVTLLQVQGRQFLTLATDGDVKLGGRDLDEQLVERFCQEFLQQHGLDPRADPQGQQYLLRLAVEAKHALSKAEHHTTICKWQGLRVTIETSRSEFEDLIEPLIERTLATCEEVMRIAKLRWPDVHRLLLVGGSSRIPLVSRKLQQLTGLTPTLSESPDELIAQGAALCASTHTGHNQDQFRIVNVNAHSLGVRGVNPQTGERINDIVIRRNTPLPASSSRKYPVAKDDQRTVVVFILEGESTNPKYCTLLGRCTVQLEPGVVAGTIVEVICQYAANGTISVSARLPTTRHSADVTIHREDAADLEPLIVWEHRLLGKEPPNIEPASRAYSATADSSTDPQTASAIAERLDYLYTQVGKTAVDLTLPIGVMSAQRTVRSANAERDLLKKLLASAQTAKDRVTDRMEMQSYSGDIAVLRMFLQYSEATAKHSLIVLGRECIGAGFYPPQSEPLLDEIHRLQADLNAAV